MYDPVNRNKAESLERVTMKKLTSMIETVKSSVYETLTGPKCNKLTGHIYYLSAMIWFNTLRKALKQAIPNIKKESRTGMKTWYILVTFIIAVAYSTYAVKCIKFGDMYMERYANEKLDRETFEDLQNEDDFDDEVKPE